MALLNDPAKNFINALSAFWNTFFVDAQQLRTYFDGAQINLGQLYLDLLQTVLGTSLEHMPLYSRHYFKYLEIRESQVFYAEGETPALDQYVYAAPGLTIAGATTLTNKVLTPTATLLARRDYVVSDGAVRFNRNIFDVDGQGGSEPNFPVRYVDEVFPATFTDPGGFDWATNGAKVGDYFRLKILGGGDPTYTRIIGVDGATLYLADKQPDFVQDFSNKTFKVSVVREPYNNPLQGVLTPAKPNVVFRMSSATTNGVTVAGTKDVDLTGEPFWRGAWTPLTSYAAGDVVEHLGAPYWSRSTHTAGATFELARWFPLLDSYIYVSSNTSPLNCGLARCQAAAGGLLNLDRTLNFEATTPNRVALIVMSLSGTFTAGPRPVVTLPQYLLIPGTVALIGTRALPIRALRSDGTFESLRGGESLREGVDYAVNYETGDLVILTPWSSVAAPRVSYEWWREALSQSYTNPALTPFAFNKSYPTRTLAMWGTDLLLDEGALFNNFGYLLDFQRPTSEQYRAFLRGVSQLFLLGPTLERFESAMNVMANLPVVQDDDELLLNYDDGIVASGSDGELIDYDSGRDGTLSAAQQSFTAPTATFYASDLGARLSVRSGENEAEYAVVAVINQTTVQLQPVPPDQAVDYWSFRHVSLTSRFRSGSALFTPDDLNGTLLIRNANSSRNNGEFKVIAVDDASTLVLEAPFGLDDATALDWSLSRSGQQTVTTTQRSYALPLITPVREDIADSANFGVLSLRAFEALTTAFQVIDYVRDPTWWHHVVIPDGVLQLDNDTPERRRVTPEYIENRYDALDQATFGDFGVAYGVNDEAMPGQQRRGVGVWFGVHDVQLTFAPNTPLARLRDVGQSLVIRTPGFEGSYPIRSVRAPTAPGGIEHAVVTLDRFPPRSAAPRVPPVTLDVELPPLLYRRTVAFILMDRFLKYHALTLRIDRNVALPADFVEDVTRLIREAKPAHTYIYLEALTAFYDRLRLIEDVTVGYGPYYDEPIFRVDNQQRYSLADGLRYGDAFRYTDNSTSVPGAAGMYTLPTGALPVGSVETSLVKVRFDSGVTVNGGARQPAEGIDYTVDYAAGKLTVLPTASFDNLSNLVHFVYCVRRIRLSGDPLDAGETPIAYGSTNPRVHRAPLQSPQQMGLVDRAVQITLGP